MSINNSITNNPNIRMFLLKTITKKFQGYIAGLGGNNSIFNLSSDVKAAEINAFLEKHKDALEFNNEEASAAKALIDTILDTGQGAFRSADYFSSSKIYDEDILSSLSEPDSRIIQIKEKMTVIPSKNTFIKTAARDSGPGGLVIDIMAKEGMGMETEDGSDFIFIDNLIEEGFSATTILPSTGDVLVDYFDRSLDLKPSSNIPMEICAYILKDKFLNRQSRFKEVLNLFLNGIPPLEMARCSPFLDITIYTDNRSKSSKKYLNHAYHMRFGLDGDGTFTLSNADSLNMTQASRVENDKREEGYDSHFMSIFQSSQTMANANINKGSNISDVNNFLEPIVPLLSLNSFQVTIDGMGHGLTSSRRGSIGMVLHDRSRLEDFAPLVSLSQLSGTTMRIEFGWSHPDGNPITSENDIGKFLNACRDVQFYNLNTTNLSFNNTSVNIDITITSSAGEIAKQVSAAAGYFSPLSFVSNKINAVISRIIQNQSDLENVTGTGEESSILPNLKVLRTDASNVAQMIQTEDYRELLSLLALGSSESSVSDIKILRQVLVCLLSQNSEQETLDSIPEVTDNNDRQILLDFIGNLEIKSNAQQALQSTAQFIMSKLEYAARPGTAKELKTRDINVMAAMNSDFIKEVNGLETQTEIEFAKEKSEALFSKVKKDRERTEESIKKNENRIKELEDEKEELEKKSQKLKKAKKVQKELVDNDIKKLEKKINQLSEKNKNLKVNLEFTEGEEIYAESLEDKVALEIDEGNLYPTNITFCKLFMLYCGLPLLSTCEYEEIQVMFYGINQHAAGARKFTTASFPIEISEVRRALLEKFKNASGNMTVQSMFIFLSNLVKNKSLSAYGLDDTIDDFKKEIEEKKDTEEFFQEALDDYYVEGGKDQDIESDEKKKQSVINQYINKKFSQKQSDKLTEIYKNDGLIAVPSNRFVEPVFKLHMEVIPVLKTQTEEEEANRNFFTLASDFLTSALSVKNQNTGYEQDKKILRMHVYDQRASGNPKAEFLNQIAKSDKIEILSGKLPDLESGIIEKFKKSDKYIQAKGTSDAATLLAEAQDRAGTAMTDLVDNQINKTTSIVKNMSIQEFRQFVKRSYPNVTWGANSSVVKTLQISSNTSDRLAQNILIRRKRDARSGGSKKNSLISNEEVSIFPSTVTLDIMGCPFIDRGAHIYIDTGTGTDLDNVYVVNNVTHSVKSGEFLTQLKLLCTGQGTISSQKKVLEKKLKTAVEKLKEDYAPEE